MINKVIIQGRMAACPEVRTTQSGHAVCSFTVATDGYSRGDEKTTYWIDCVAWRKTADFIAKYFGKGEPIAIEGALTTRTYTDKDGNKRKACEVLVERAHFCAGKRNENVGAARDDEGDVGYEEVELPDGDLPF